jgi:hypothetical protein
MGEFAFFRIAEGGNVPDAALSDACCSQWLHDSLAHIYILFHVPSRFEFHLLAILSAMSRQSFRDGMTHPRHTIKTLIFCAPLIVLTTLSSEAFGFC